MHADLISLLTAVEKCGKKIGPNRIHVFLKEEREEEKEYIYYISVSKG